MPTQQRVRAHEERPALSAQQLAGRSKEDAVTLIQPRTRDLAAKNREFVAEHHDLELLELARAQTQRRHRKRTDSTAATRLRALRTTGWIYVPDTTSDRYYGLQNDYWLRELTDKNIRRSSFPGVPGPDRQHRGLPPRHHANPKRLIWTAPAESIL
jgi:hypothetical protein